MKVDKNDATEDENIEQPVHLSCSGRAWTIIAGAASGFLGGLCGIRGPPIILYFLHAPVLFMKDHQRATGACITFTNVVMRILYYVNKITFFDKTHTFQTGSWVLYVSIIVSSNIGVLVGSKLFDYVKDSKRKIKGILAIF